MSECQTETVSIDVLKAKVSAWMDCREMPPGKVLWYTDAEWLARQEDVGNGAPLSAVIESSQLFSILNYGTTKEAHAIEEELYRLLEKLGYYCELGYTWSLHFYPL